MASLLCSPSLLGLRNVGRRVALPHSARRVGEHWVAVRVFLSTSNRLQVNVEWEFSLWVRLSSVFWKSPSGLPLCSSGPFRKCLHIVGEILQLRFALGGPVAKAYSSHLGCLHTRWGKTGTPGEPCLGHPWQDEVTHPQHDAHISPRAEEVVVLPSDVTCTRPPRPMWLGHSPLSSNLDKNHREKLKHSSPRKHVSPSSVGLGESRIRSASLQTYPVLLHLHAHLLLETWCPAEGKLSSQLLISYVLALVLPLVKALQ